MGTRLHLKIYRGEGEVKKCKWEVESENWCPPTLNCWIAHDGGR